MKKSLRVGIIGAGAVVREIYQHLYFHSSYSGMIEISAVADPQPANRNWLADLAGLPAERRFDDYREMLAKCELDAVQVNTPDHLHRQPAVEALAAGLEVIIPKPLAATIADAHAIVEAAKQAGRFLGVDFHKREDPRIKEATARFQAGRYGRFQAAVFYMLDKLSVADPNHQPRFFASADYAEKNTPVSFLTVHMADALMHIVNQVPVQVRCAGYSHKLPSLQPVPVHGYDLVDTEVVFDTGAVAHILTGWALPNTAWATTVQSARLICSEGLMDLALDAPGLNEIHADGVLRANPLFRNFEPDQTVSGYGIAHPGRLYERALAWRSRQFRPQEMEAMLSPQALGFYSTLVIEGAELSLAKGRKLPGGATLGEAVDLPALLAAVVGAEAAQSYQLPTAVQIP
jgi:predicted dehydrogenase